MSTSSFHRWIATLGLACGLSLLANCSRQEGPADPGTVAAVQAPSPAPTAPPQEKEVAAVSGPTATAPAAQANSRSITVEGLTLRLESGGHVNLSGKDRWGGDYNTTYENPKFLLEALPVLERTFSSKQVEAVRKQLGHPPTETAK